MTPPNRVHSAKVETNKLLEPTAVHKTDTLVRCRCSQFLIPLDLIANTGNSRKKNLLKSKQHKNLTTFFNEDMTLHRKKFCI